MLTWKISKKSNKSISRCYELCHMVFLNVNVLTAQVQERREMGGFATAGILPGQYKREGRRREGFLQGNKYTFQSLQ